MENENFETIYTKLCNEDFSDLENKRKKLKRLRFIFILSSIIAFCVLIISLYAKVLAIFISLTSLWFNVFFVVSSISIISFFILLFSSSKKSEFIEEYKHRIINKLIEYVFENSNYDPSSYIAKENYDKCCFGEYYTNLSGNDYISATINILNKNIPLTFSEMIAKKEVQDADGKTTTYTSFYGIAGYILLTPKIDSNIEIRQNNAYGIFKKNVVKLDSNEFEKYFDVNCSSQINAMQFLTSDIMDELVEIVKVLNVPLEINIVSNDKIYFRLLTYSVFEPKLLKDILDEKMMERFFNILICIKKLAYLSIDAMEDLNIGGKENE